MAQNPFHQATPDATPPGDLRAVDLPTYASDTTPFPAPDAASDDGSLVVTMLADDNGAGTQADAPPRVAKSGGPAPPEMGSLLSAAAQERVATPEPVEYEPEEEEEAVEEEEEEEVYTEGESEVDEEEEPAYHEAKPERHPVQTPQEVRREKESLLFRLYAIRKKGAVLSQKYTMESNLEDMRDEYRIQKYHIDRQASRKFSQKMLVMIVTALEFMNERWDPFDIHLDGWSESVHENITDYDEVFDQLYEKYREKVSMAPEVKLMLMLGGSAFMFHMTNSMFRPSTGGGLPSDAVEKMMSAAKQEVASGAPLTPMKPDVPKEPGLNPVPGTRPVVTPPRPVPEEATVDDILKYLEPREAAKRKDDDAQSESTVVSFVTSGGTRRRKRKQRNVMSLQL